MKTSLGDTGQVAAAIYARLCQIRNALVVAFNRTKCLCSKLLGRGAKKQIIICGYPRSGTSLLYNMMTATLQDFQFDTFENSCTRYINRCGNYISKVPLDVFQIRHLPGKNVLKKKLYVVILLRDPRDIITSRHPRLPGSYFIGYESCYRIDGPNGYDPQLVNPGIQAIYQEIESLRSLPGIELVFVKYEDLVEKPDFIQHFLGQCLQVTFNGQFSSFHEAGDSLAYQYQGCRAPLDPSLVRENRPVDPSRIGKWRTTEHKERVQTQFSGHSELFDIVRRYGYESDDSWFKAYS